MPSGVYKRKIDDLSDQKFNRLRVLKFSHKNKWNESCWLCRCDCKNEVVVRGSFLKSGSTMSCGCLNKERSAKRLLRITFKHGKTGTPTFTSWSGLHQRCNDKNHPAYKNYGGRGITYCDRWNKFVNFLEDMGERPNGLSIDRINNNGNYEPSNCRWATPKEQQRNRRDNVLYDFQGSRMTLPEISEIIGVKPRTLWRRINNLGWTLKRAFVAPLASMI